MEREHAAPGQSGTKKRKAPADQGAPSSAAAASAPTNTPSSQAQAADTSADASPGISASKRRRKRSKKSKQPQGVQSQEGARADGESKATSVPAGQSKGNGSQVQKARLLQGGRGNDPPPIAKAHAKPSTKSPSAPSQDGGNVAPRVQAHTSAPKSAGDFYQRTNPHKPSALPHIVSNGARSRKSAHDATAQEDGGHAGRATRYTLSIALPGSIVLNAQSPELQARLAGQVARTAAIFGVDEIVVFHEEAEQTSYAAGTRGVGGRGPRTERSGERHMGGEDAAGAEGGSGFDPDAFLARLLQYLEAPQYLRKALFPMHRDLRLAGLLPPLDCPHHLRFEDCSPFREGVVVEPPPWSAAARASSTSQQEQARRKKGRNSQAESVAAATTCWVNVGLREPVESLAPGLTREVGLPTGMRVTVEMPATEGSNAGSKGRLVSPREPVEKGGVYWGYSVRLCASLSDVLTGQPAWSTLTETADAGVGDVDATKTSTASTSAPSVSAAAPYDLVIGTSERGESLSELVQRIHDQHRASQTTEKTTRAPSLSGDAATSMLPPRGFRHALVVLGGLSGLEVAVERDQGIRLEADEAHELFDLWLNVVEGQGSRTIRTEEALMIALARLRPALDLAAAAGALPTASST